MRNRSSSSSSSSSRGRSDSIRMLNTSHTVCTSWSSIMLPALCGCPHTSPYQLNLLL